ncbi:MAG TPA: hypothetical protein VN538_01575 [Clostridia bacterium]|nr:hypothetical protein [Clostridia bacterium]
MIKHMNLGKNKRKTAAMIACLFFCLLTLMITVACQPGKPEIVLTPIPVEQTAEVEQPTETNNNAQATEKPIPAAELWNPAKELLNSAAALPDAIPVSVSHISQPPETLPAGIRVLVDADVVVPQVEIYQIQEWKKSSFTLDDYRDLIDYFIPNAKWVPNQTVPGFQTNGTFNLEDIDMENGTTFTAEQDGEMFSVSLWGKSFDFWFSRAGEGIIREGYLVGDKEWEQEAGKIIRAPIAITQEAAKTQADRVLSDLNIQGWQIESVQRSVAVDIDNYANVISHGWCFVYGLSNAGLTTHADSGSSSGNSDRLSYWRAEPGIITIYVDERGVTDFHWSKRYTPGSVTYPVASIISAEEALKLAKERIARIYGELDYENTQIEIYDIRLSTMLIGYSDQLTGQPFPDPYEDIALLIPTWNIAFREIYSEGDTEYYMMPFSTTDGGAISMLFY